MAGALKIFGEDRASGKMCCVYVLKSLKNNKRYIGFSRKDPNIRLAEHNKGANSYTKANKPFVLLYSEKFFSEEKAIKREKFLKTGQGRKFLNKIIPP